MINGIAIICMRSDALQPARWKLFIPPSLIRNLIHWYHVTLGHCGIQRLYDTINNRFVSPRISVLCKEYTCPVNCHQWTQQGQGYGRLRPRIAQVIPWDDVAVDLVGPWKINANNREYIFNALTCIYPVTNLV